MKETLFKFLFPNKFRKIQLLEKEIDFLEACAIEQEEHECPKHFLEPLDFANVDEKGKPVHYLKNLTEIERKNWIAGMESIYSDEKFQKIINYAINVWGNNSFQVEPDETKMYRGRYAVLGIRTLMEEFQKAHSEYLDSKKKPEEFDKFAILPED